MQVARPLFHRLPLVVLLIATLARSAGGQEMRGTVRDSASRRAIPGAVLTLFDSSGVVLGRMLTNERGEYRFARSSGSAKLRVQRLGFRMREVPMPASGNDVRQVDVAMVSLPTLLEAVRVLAGANCPRRSDGVAAFALLQQARAGLLTTVVAREANPGKLVRLGFERRMDATSDRITEQKVRIDSVGQTAVSFKAVRTGADFVRRGFMDDRSTRQVFFGPDAEVLLDDGFAGGYCFRIMDPDRVRPNQIGLGFAAADRKRDRVDIDGALWIDTIARALRDIEYRYVGLGDDQEVVRPGGWIFFREMANGVVLIDRWFIRLPSQEADTSYDRTGRRMVRGWFSANENGGELARARWPDGTVWRGSLGTLRVHALIHLEAPAAGMVVRLANTDYRAVADSSGNFEIADLVPGPYSLIVVEPHLAEFGITPPSPLKFVAGRDSTVEHTLNVKTLEDYIFDRCVADRRGSLGAVLVLGRVETPYGVPVENAKVTFAFTAGQPFYAYTTGADGTFQVCLGESARRAKVMIRARVGAGPSVNASRTLTEKVTLVHILFDPPPRTR